jgi:hypothetical protein
MLKQQSLNKIDKSQKEINNNLSYSSFFSGGSPEIKSNNTLKNINLSINKSKDEL